MKKGYWSVKMLNSTTHGDATSVGLTHHIPIARPPYGDHQCQHQHQNVQLNRALECLERRRAESLASDHLPVNRADQEP